MLSKDKFDPGFTQRSMCLWQHYNLVSETIPLYWKSPHSKIKYEIKIQRWLPSESKSIIFNTGLLLTTVAMLQSQCGCLAGIMPIIKMRK